MPLSWVAQRPWAVVVGETVAELTVAVVVVTMVVVAVVIHPRAH